MITVVAPDGIGEITPQSDLAAEIVAAAQASEAGGLRDGDVLVVTSKIISKLEGCVAAADDRDAVLAEQTVRTVARRAARFAIVETRHGLVQAAAGIDNSNVAAGTILTLPTDPDASADRLRVRVRQLTGARVGVIVSDTSGRAWRTGQTDHAIGVSGVVAVLSYAGQTDDYGNDLRVTAMAVADELAGAADLAKAKLRQRPVAIVRGVGELLGDGSAHDLVRPVADDLFRLGTREAVIEAVAAAVGSGHDLESLFRAAPDDAVAALTDGLGADQAAVVTAVLRHAFDAASPTD